MDNVSLLALSALVAYLLVLMGVAFVVGRRGGNDAFFRAGRRAPWPLVAFGMVGASVTGVSVVSVPGYVGATGMSYLQMCLGFVAGYAVVALVLLPVYYKGRVTSIYTYLQERFGSRSRMTGAAFFCLSKLTRACAAFCLTATILHRFLLAPLGVPLELGVGGLLLAIWLYTRRGGLRTLVYTDALQTLCMLAAVAGILMAVAGRMGLSLQGIIDTVSASPLSRVFVLDDWMSRQAFWKQFLSGIFIVIVMTGLDQDMMQKNLACKNLASARKDMLCYGLCFVPLNLLLLSLGVLLYAYCDWSGLVPPASGDSLLPWLVESGGFGPAVTVLFVLGISAATFSSVDSAMTSLTTSLCVDFMAVDSRPEAGAQRLRRRIHLTVVAVFAVATLLFGRYNGTSIIDAIYTMAGYTYGPLLGLFGYGLLCRRRADDRWVPLIAVVAPVLSHLLAGATESATGYVMGYELLMLNGLLTGLGLYLTSR